MAGDKDKEDSMYAAAHAISSAVIGFVISSIVMAPFDKAFRKIKDDPKKYLQGLEELLDVKEIGKRKLEKSKALFSSLELPWERYIPILYQAFSLYFIHMNEPNTRLKALKLTSELMSAVVLLSQSGRLISQLTTFCHEESGMLKKWMDENKK